MRSHRPHALLRHLLDTFGTELRPLARLAAPVVLSEVSWMVMGLIETMLVGRVSAEALGGIAIGGNIFYPVAIPGMGILLGLDYAVAYAHGAGNAADAHRSLLHGMYVSAALTVALMAFLWSAIPHLAILGVQDAVLRQAVPYLEALVWSLGPLLLYTTLRSYLQARGLVTAVMVVMVSSNIVYAATAWLLIFGRLGLPAMGTSGAGWAVTIARIYTATALVAYTVAHDWRHHTGLLRTPTRFEAQRLLALVRLGLPAALQRLLEVGVFATAAILAGHLDPTSLAAHHIALSAAGFTFMVPLGISAAGAVRVGQALGQRDPAQAARSGWTALLLGAAVMSCTALGFVLAPRIVLRLFTGDEAVITTGVALLLVAALFQLGDGLQVVATGALRGAGNTRTAMIANFVGHWMIGLPVGYGLCFWWKCGIVGLWIGLALGLTSVAVALLAAWVRRVRGWRGQVQNRG